MFFARGYNGAYHCFDRFGFMPGGGWMVLIYVALIVIAITIVLLVSRNRRSQLMSSLDSKALDELKMLFARGAISEEEYLKRRNILSD